MTLSQLQYYRKKNGYSYGKLAELSGVPLSTVQKIFGGITKTPRYETIQALEKVLIPEEKGNYMEEQEKSQPMDVVREQHFYNATSEARKQKELHTLEDYYALPEEMRVELIDGVFFEMTAPRTSHQTITMEVCMALSIFITSKNGECVPFAAPTDVQLDCDEYTMIQPDVLVVCDRSKITGPCIVGAPDFIVEVLSKSTRKKDMTLKLTKYVNAGVREYWMIDLEKERILVYDLKNEDSLLTIYGLEDQIPVRIFECELVIDFAQIMKRIIVR
ncbi:MAG: Uma2 family endonuclease [Lachnospiraceae bacterium]|nr:Uma2 family endonuclease [Lachnospiraceae bacterium]